MDILKRKDTTTPTTHNTLSTVTLSHIICLLFHSFIRSFIRSFWLHPFRLLFLHSFRTRSYSEPQGGSAAPSAGFCWLLLLMRHCVKALNPVGAKMKNRTCFDAVSPFFLRPSLIVPFFITCSHPVKLSLNPDSRQTHTQQIISRSHLDPEQKRSVFT